MRETVRRLAQSVDGSDLRRMFAPGQQMPGGFPGADPTRHPTSLAEQVCTRDVSSTLQARGRSTRLMTGNTNLRLLISVVLLELTSVPTPCRLRR